MPRARPRTARLCPWIVRACREIDGWIASVTKAAKIFCARGCLRTGVQLCALSRRARVSDEGGFPMTCHSAPPLSRRACVFEEGGFPPLRVLVDPHLHARTSGEALRRRCSWCAGDAMRDPAPRARRPPLWYALSACIASSKAWAHFSHISLDWWIQGRGKKI